MINKILLKKDKDRYSDSFYVTFTRLPKNSQNVLGRQLISITRPDVTFNIVETRQKSSTTKTLANVELGSIRMTFHEDEESVTSTLLNVQMFRQLHKQGSHLSLSDADKSFDIHIALLNSDDEVTGEMILERCYIKSLSHSELSYAQSEYGTIDVECSVDDIDVKINEKFADKAELIEGVHTFNIFRDK